MDLMSSSFSNQVKYQQFHSSRRVPVCVRLLQLQKEKSRQEALCYRAAWPSETRAYLDHNGEYLYDHTPLSVRVDEQHRMEKQRLADIRRKMESLQKVIEKNEPPEDPLDINVDAMMRRMQLAHMKEALRVGQPAPRPRRSQRSPRKPARQHRK